MHSIKIPTKILLKKLKYIKAKIDNKVIPNISTYHLKSIFTFNILIVSNIVRNVLTNKDVVVAIAAPAIPR